MQQSSNLNAAGPAREQHWHLDCPEPLLASRTSPRPALPICRHRLAEAPPRAQPASKLQRMRALRLALAPRRTPPARRPSSSGATSSSSIAATAIISCAGPCQSSGTCCGVVLKASSGILLLLPMFTFAQACVHDNTALAAAT
eukprot:1322737-Rhodomonas_salina.4